MGYMGIDGANRRDETRRGTGGKDCRESWPRRKKIGEKEEGKHEAARDERSRVTTRA